MNGRQKKKKFRKFILACEGYRKSRERMRRENVEWRKDARRLRQSLWYSQEYSYPNRYRNKTTARKYVERHMDALFAKWGLE